MVMTGFDSQSPRQRLFDRVLAFGEVEHTPPAVMLPPPPDQGGLPDYADTVAQVMLWASAPDGPVIHTQTARSVATWGLTRPWQLFASRGRVTEDLIGLIDAEFGRLVGDDDGYVSTALVALRGYLTAVPAHRSPSDRA